jgi:hypothetical protein
MVMMMVQTHPILAGALAEPQCADKPAGYTSDLGRRFTFGDWVVPASNYAGSWFYGGPTSSDPSRTRTGRCGMRAACSSRSMSWSAKRVREHNEVGGLSRPDRR